MIQHLLRALLVTILSLALFGCGQQDEQSFTILASTVHKFMEPQVTAVGRRMGINVQMTYQPSPDITNGLRRAKPPASTLYGPPHRSG